MHSEHVELGTLGALQVRKIDGQFLAELATCQDRYR